MLSRDCAIVARMRLSAGEALSLISPLGRMARRISAARERKSASAAARSARRGYFAVASSRSVCFRLVDVSISDAASRISASRKRRRRLGEAREPVGGVGETAEAELRARAEIRDGFANQVECRAQRIRVRARSESVNRAMARRTRGVPREDFAEAAKFEEFFGGAAHQFKMREPARGVKFLASAHGHQSPTSLPRASRRKSQIKIAAEYDPDSRRNISTWQRRVPARTTSPAPN